MPLQTKMSNNLDQTLRDQLDGNFEELDKSRTNINGYVFNSTAERLNAIEKGLKTLGIPIDPNEEQEYL